MEFAENLKEAMFCKKMTTRELSQQTNIKIDTLNSYLKTNGSIPTVDKALKIAKALDVSVDFLVNGFESYTEKNSVQPISSQAIEIDKLLKNLSKQDAGIVLLVAKALNEKYQNQNPPTRA